MTINDNQIGPSDGATQTYLTNAIGSTVSVATGYCAEIVASTGDGRLANDAALKVLDCINEQNRLYGTKCAVNTGSTALFNSQGGSRVPQTNVGARSW
jgi:hypothetical protein